MTFRDPGSTFFYFFTHGILSVSPFILFRFVLIFVFISPWCGARGQTILVRRVRGNAPVREVGENGWDGVDWESRQGSRVAAVSAVPWWRLAYLLTYLLYDRGEPRFSALDWASI